MTPRVALCWLVAGGSWLGALGALGTVLAPLLLACGCGWLILGCTEWDGGRP